MENLIDQNIKKDGEYSSYKLFAAGAVWDDITSYSRDTRGKIQPTAFRLKFKGWNIFITSGHIYYKGKWIMGCQQLNLKEIECVGCKTPTEAAEYAIQIVKNKINEMMESLNFDNNGKK